MMKRLKLLIFLSLMAAVSASSIMSQILSLPVDSEHKVITESCQNDLNLTKSSLASDELWALKCK